MFLAGKLTFGKSLLALRLLIEAGAKECFRRDHCYIKSAIHATIARSRIGPSHTPKINLVRIFYRAKKALLEVMLMSPMLTELAPLLPRRGAVVSRARRGPA